MNKTISGTTSISVTAFREQLTDVIRRVKAGEVFLITRYGVPMAYLVKI
jgi:prevent-host-death family protein